MKNAVRRFVRLLLLGTVASLSILACSVVSSPDNTHVQQPVPDCRTVQHVMGRTCIPQKPQRIVMLREDYWINSLQLGVRAIATVSLSGFPFPKYLEGEIDKIESVGGYGSPNMEKILSLRPDLILAESSYPDNLYKQLSQIAPTVVLNMPFPSPPWEDQLKELAYVLDREAEGEQLINDYWRRVDDLRQSLGDRRHSLKVSIANTSSEYGIWSYGANHFSGSVLRDVGLQRPESQKGDFFYIDNISKEKISDLDGDVLFFVSASVIRV